MTDEQKTKQLAIEAIQRRTDGQREQLAGIDPRLLEYYTHLCEHSGTTLGDPNDLHGMNELLCALRLLRLLRTYDFNRDKVEEEIFADEGEWQRDAEGYWTHIRGGLGQPGRMGNEVYRCEPFQIFMLTAIYGPMAWIGTGNYEGDRRLTDTERVNPTTREIEDLRRLCIRFVLFGPRKINKSGFAAMRGTSDMMRGDYDAQIVCTANSQEQSKILFNKTKDLLLQLDPVSGRRFNGKYLTFTNTSVKFQKGKFRAAELQAIPAGGKMPDGKFASMSLEDEYGSAGYTNGRSDMGQTAAVIESSMGPRREPLTIITTTASLISSGPFMEMLDAMHRLLLQELKYDTGEATPTLAEDRQMMLLLEPDEWEREEEYLLTSRVLRRKINPRLGKIVQHSFYEQEVASSRMDETKKKETISKLFNVYQSGKVTQWLTGDRIRPLQIARRVTDCKYQDGWRVCTGWDFSPGDDLFARTYLCVDYTRSETPEGHLFADCDAWVLEETMKNSPNRPLYEQWIDAGWLHVCPGEVFDSMLAMNRLGELVDSGVDIVTFGFDPAQNRSPINQLKAWLQTLFQKRNPNVSVKELDEVIKRMVVPVSQTAMTMNPIIGHVEDLVKDPARILLFSENPMWPWQFGNCACEISSSNLRRIIKGGPIASHKIDCVFGLLDAMWAFDLSEGQVSE